LLLQGETLLPLGQKANSWESLGYCLDAAKVALVLSEPQQETTKPTVGLEMDADGARGSRNRGES